MRISLVPAMYASLKCSPAGPVGEPDPPNVGRGRLGARGVQRPGTHRSAHMSLSRWVSGPRRSDPAGNRALRLAFPVEIKNPP